MSITKRISRLVKADIHAVLDLLEDPRSVLEQAIRDMEEIVAEHEAAEQQASTHAARLSERMRQIEKERTELESRVRAALDAQNEELARSLIRRMLELKREAETLATLRERAERDRSSSAKLLAEERERVARMKEKLTVIASESDMSHSTVSHSAVKAGVIRDEDIESELLRLRGERGTYHPQAESGGNK